MTYRPEFRCERCGDEMPVIEVTKIGDREPQYIQGGVCGCPGPRCPLCHQRLNADGFCPSLAILECPVGGCIIPIPDYA